MSRYIAPSGGIMGTSTNGILTVSNSCGTPVILQAIPWYEKYTDEELLSILHDYRPNVLKLYEEELLHAEINKMVEE